jgi:hypothetical protein
VRGGCQPVRTNAVMVLVWQERAVRAKPDDNYGPGIPPGTPCRDQRRPLAGAFIGRALTQREPLRFPLQLPPASD